MRSRGRGMEGQVTPLVAVAVVLAGGIALVIGHIGGMLADHAQARAAADAAALAGAMAGPAAAEEAATANGATLVDIEVNGADTEVRVRVGDAVALARARRGLSSAARATAFEP
ncbi:MAG TPA: pilus assembly protein TadG-related protein [Acidimicrobiales bacterium]|nr:pilus assembly protein TadG-related protein [Acidimicrobiales bacterium]